MPKQIDDLLHRRNDLATSLVHLTRDRGSTPARERLIQILVGGEPKARSAMGMAVQAARTDADLEESQKVVCFTETPLEHVWMLCEDIETRSVRLQPYGVAFTKTWARRRGVNPIMYIDITTGHDWLTNPINDMVAAAQAGKTKVREGGQWVTASTHNAPIFKLTPFFEQMGNPSGTRKEFWWEREWRHVGPLYFAIQNVVAVFVPESDHDDFIEELSERYEAEAGRVLWRPPKVLDPRWGLERRIASLADVDPYDVGPFPEWRRAVLATGTSVFRRRPGQLSPKEGAGGRCTCTERAHRILRRLATDARISGASRAARGASARWTRRSRRGGSEVLRLILASRCAGIRHRSTRHR